MSTTAERAEAITQSATARAVDLKLEVVVIPVSNVERALRFYRELGWRLDADFVVGNDFRVAQLTPPGSPCSIQFGTGMTPAAPGSARGMYLVVSDIEAARTGLMARGAEVSEVFHRVAIGKPPVKGRDPEGRSYNSFATFSDPDGNSWLLQEVTARLPGRVDSNEATYTSPAELASALRRAANAHGEHEKLIGKADANWPEWYSEYMLAEATGKPLPT